MVFITIVTGAYEPTYNWGASHCTNLPQLVWSTGWWYTYPSEKIWKSVGIMTFPTEWKNKTCSKPPTSLLWGSPTWGGGWLNLYVKRPNPSYPSNLKLTYADTQNMHHSYGHWLVITCYNWLFLWDINHFYGVIAVTYNWYDSGRNLQLKKKRVGTRQYKVTFEDFCCDPMKTIVRSCYIPQPRFVASKKQT